MLDQNLLHELRDIHYPAPISWWPPAPGWVGLFIILAILGFILGILGYRYWMRKKKRQFILQQLETLEKMAQHEPYPSEIIRQLTTLLKQVVLLLYPRKEVAGLSGESWLDFLNQKGNTEHFTKGVGRLLMSAPYQAAPPKETPALINLVKQWITQQITRGL